MLGAGVQVLIIGGDAAYVGRKATLRASLRLNVAGHSHVLGWFLKEGWLSSKTGLEILWNEKNLMPLNGNVEHSDSSRQLERAV